MMPMDDYLKKLAQAVRPFPTDSDPARYPRAAAVTDDAVLLLIAELDVRGDELRALGRKMAVLMADVEALRVRIFARLEELHPEVCTPAAEAHGWRVHQGRTYYVSWDFPKEE